MQPRGQPQSWRHRRGKEEQVREQALWSSPTLAHCSEPGRHVNKDVDYSGGGVSHRDADSVHATQ